MMWDLFVSFVFGSNEEAISAIMGSPALKWAFCVSCYAVIVTGMLIIAATVVMCFTGRRRLF